MLSFVFRVRTKVLVAVGVFVYYNHKMFPELLCLISRTT